MADTRRVWELTLGDLLDRLPRFPGVNNPADVAAAFVRNDFGSPDRIVNNSPGVFETFHSMLTQTDGRVYIAKGLTADLINIVRAANRGGNDDDPDSVVRILDFGQGVATASAYDTDTDTDNATTTNNIPEEWQASSPLNATPSPKRRRVEEVSDSESESESESESNRDDDDTECHVCFQANDDCMCSICPVCKCKQGEAQHIHSPSEMED
jgi:hypothetical protein